MKWRISRRSRSIYSRAAPGWRADVDAPAAVHGAAIIDSAMFVRALEGRRKLFREWVSRPLTTPEPEKVWNAAYSAGLKDGLAVERKP